MNSEEYKSSGRVSELIRIRLLAGLLRLADEIEISYKRAPENLFEQLQTRMNNYSQLQWFKHHYTATVVIEKNNRERMNKTEIQIHFHYPNQDVADKLTPIILKPIKEEIDYLKDIFTPYGLSLELKQSEISIKPGLKIIPENVYMSHINKDINISMEIPKAKGFLGRDSELEELTNSLDNNIVIIEGIAGIGKTYIASKFAETLKDKFVVYWHGNISETTSISSVIKKLSVFLSQNGKDELANSIENFGYDIDVLINILVSELNENKFVLFFDDYHKAEKELKPLMEQMLQLTSSKIVLITREKPSFYNVVDEVENRVSIFTIDSWSSESTNKLLENRHIKTDIVTTKKIHEMLHGHPQYLNLFCILALKSNPKELFEQIPKALESAYSYLEKEVYNSLSLNEKSLIKIIAIYRLPQEIDAYYLDEQMKDVDDVLSKLIDKFLVNEIGNKKYTIHEIMRDYCINDVKKKKTIRSINGAAGDYYLSLDKEPENILEAVFHYNEATLKERATEVLVANTSQLISKGFWEKIEAQLLKSLLMFRRTNQPYKLHLLAKINLNIGSLYYEKRDWDEAYKFANDAKNLLKKAKVSNKNFYTTYTLMSSIYFKRDQLDKAKEYNDKCETIANAEDNLSQKMIAKGNLVMIENPSNEEKLRIYNEINEYFEEQSDNNNTVSSYRNLSNTYRVMKQYEKAACCLKKALKILKENKNSYNIIESKVSLARVYINNPNNPIHLVDIIECLNECLNVYKKIGHIRGKAEVLELIGDAYFSDGKESLALENMNKAEQIYQSLNYIEGEVNLNSKMAHKYIKLKKYSDAEHYLEKMNLLDPLNINNLLNASEIYILLGKYKDAYTFSTKATNEIENKDVDMRYCLALLITAISLLKLGKNKEVVNCLRLIGAFNFSKADGIKWSFSEIETMLKGVENYTVFFEDVISLLKNEEKYPKIRINDVEILRETKGTEATVYHPFTGNYIIEKKDKDFINLFQKLSDGQIINDSNSKILDIDRSKALLIIGFLANKNVLDYEMIDQNNIMLKLN
ncbi:MAG: hypothetical protein K8R13_09270 [Methanococcoides sp.]|nr:hypothetical protein [Methanococcoides sp.]